jgi:hypothetical protein
MADDSNQRQLPAQRKTGHSRRVEVQETADPSGRRPVAQWVISGSVARPAHEALPDPAVAPGGLPVVSSPRPAWWLLAGAAAVGFAVAVPITWLVFTLLGR